MSDSEGASLEPALTELEEKLREVDERLRSEMRARGFDPAQDENLALTARWLSYIWNESSFAKNWSYKLTGRDHSLNKIMRETERIVDQLNRAFVGEAWHGPAVLEVLKGVTAEQATARPFAGGHSIWELALHIEAWVRACGRR